MAEAALRAAEAQVKSDREAVAAAEAAIQQAEAALETARINLGYTRITAPISRTHRKIQCDRRRSCDSASGYALLQPFNRLIRSMWTRHSQAPLCCG